MRGKQNKKIRWDNIYIKRSQNKASKMRGINYTFRNTSWIIQKPSQRCAEISFAVNSWVIFPSHLDTTTVRKMFLRLTTNKFLSIQAGDNFIQWHFFFRFFYISNSNDLFQRYRSIHKNKQTSQHSIYNKKSSQEPKNCCCKLSKFLYLFFRHSQFSSLEHEEMVLSWPNYLSCSV